MKLKVLSVLIIVLVAQAHIVQGIGFINIASGLTALKNATTTVTNAVTTTIANTTTAVGNVATTVVTTGATFLNNIVSTINNTIANVSSTLQKLNINPEITDVLISKTSAILTTLSNAISNLPTITQVLADQIKNLVSVILTAINNLVAGLQNATASINLPTFDVLSEIQNWFTTTGSDITTTITNAIDAGADELSGVIVPLTNTTSLPLNDILAVIGSAKVLLTGIIDTLGNKVVEIANIVKTALTGLISLLTGFTGITPTCTSNLLSALEVFKSNATANAMSCVTDEMTKFQGYISEYENLNQQYQAAIASQSISASTVEGTLTTTAAAAFEAEVAMYRLPICEVVQAINSLSNIDPIVSTLVSCLA